MQAYLRALHEAGWLGGADPVTWLLRYRVRHYIRNSILALPLLGMVAALLTARAMYQIEKAMGWQSDFSPEAARTVLATMASSMFSFMVFLSSTLLVAVQLASAQLTPRIIAFIFKDPVTRLSLTVFVFSFTFTLAGTVRITDTVPLLTSELAVYSCLVSVIVFLALLDHVGKALRSSGALRSLATRGRQVIQSVYPRHLAVPQGAPLDPPGVLGEQPTRTIANPGDGVVLGIDIRGLTSLAQRADCVIELVPQVGDFVAAEDPLFRIFRGGANLPKEALCQSVVLGAERTEEQDPSYDFRIIVDIAGKGLSPAINDPSTAVLAIDQIHHLLRSVGRRRLDHGQVCDAAGRLRLVYRTPDWEDFVHLAVTEIRQFGSESIQVVRRLRAMLENLIQTLPEERVSLLRQELSVLHKAAERSFAAPEDRALADVSDSQGVGGSGGPDTEPPAEQPASDTAPVSSQR